MNTFCIRLLLSFSQMAAFLTNDPRMYYEIKTPDHETFFVAIISKKEADSLEVTHKKNKLEDELLTTYKRYAYLLENNQVLYRQFYKSIGFILPSLADFNKVVRDKSYWQVSIQPTDDKNSLIVAEKNFTRIVVSFAIIPVLANIYRKDIAKEILDYKPFEGYRFYELKDGSCVMLRIRNDQLSEGYWFASDRDFDFFYYVLSGKERPQRNS